MAFLLRVCRYDLGDVNDTIAVMDRVIALCRQGKVGEARALADETRQHIAASPYLRLGRPYMMMRLQEVMDILDRAEVEKDIMGE